MATKMNDEEKSEPIQSSAVENAVTVRTISKRTWMIGAILIAIVVAVGMFLLGMAVGAAMQHRSQVTTNGAIGGQFGPMNGEGRFGGMRQMGARGTVTAIDGTSITLKLSDNSTKTYTINDATMIRTQASGSISASDIKVGMTVAVRLSANGSSIASSIVVFDTNTSASNSGSDQSY